MDNINIRQLLCLLADWRKLDPELSERILQEILRKLRPPDRDTGTNNGSESFALQQDHRHEPEGPKKKQV